MKKSLYIFLLLSLNYAAMAQSKGDWPHIPGFDPALPTTLTSQETFIGIIGFDGLILFPRRICI